MPSSKPEIIQLLFYRNSVSKIGWLLLFFVFYASCTKKEKVELRTTPYLDSMREIAMVMAENGDNQASFHFMDSVYSRYGHANVIDRYEYFYFFHDRYNRVRDFENGDRYIDSMFNLIRLSGDTNIMVSQYAKINFSKADRLFDQGAFNEAYNYYYKAKSIAEKSSDSCTLGYYNYKIALVLYKGEKYKDAIRFFHESFRQINNCYNELPYFYRMQEILDDIGLCYQHLRKPDSALLYYHKALDHIKDGRSYFPANKARFFEAAVAVIYGNMGSTYLDLKNDKMAEIVLNKSIDINSQPGFDYTDAQFSRIKLADLYLKQNRTDEGEEMLFEVRQVQDTASLQNMEVEMRWNNTKWHYLQKAGFEDIAFPYLLKYTAIKDSIDKVNKQALHIDIDERVVNLEKASVIDTLEKKEELRNVYLLIATIFCLMSVAIIVLIVQNSRKSRANVRLLTELNNRMNEQQRKLQGVLSELEHSDKEKDRILKAVSHDMRSPVNSALALTDLVLSDPNTTGDQMEYLKLIKNSCNNALNLTKDLLEVATLHTESLSKKDTDIKTLLSTNIELLKFRAGEKKQTINLTLPPEKVELFINEEKVIRVINNIIGNAIKFSPPYTSIDVGMKKNDDGIVISIQDSGIGIPETMKTKVFDIFTEAKRFGTSGEEPYGLGLSISKQIIEVHGGKIWFESEVGHGTTFHIYLPVRGAGVKS